MAESTTAREAAAPEDDWNVDEILDEVGIADGEPVEEGEESTEGPDELDDLHSEEDPAEESSEPPTDAASDPDAPLDTSPPAPAGAQGEQPAASDNSTQAEPKPLVFRVDNRDIAPEGAYEIDGMAVIPMDVLRNKLLRNNIVADRHEYTGRVKALERQLEETRQQRTAQDAEVASLLTHLRSLYEDPDALSEFLQDFDRQKDVILAQAERDAIAWERDQLKTARTSEEQQKWAEQEPIYRETLISSWINTLLSGEPLQGTDLDTRTLKEAGLEPREMRQLIADLALEDVLIVPAEEAEGASVINGEGSPLLLDVERLYRVLHREAQNRIRLREQTTSVAQTARQNTERVNGGARKRHGPTVAADGSPTPNSAAPEPRTVKTRRDLKEELDELNIDDILR